MPTASAHPQPHSTRIIAVTPDLITLAGDGNAAIFLAQVLFWWKVKGRNKFYKFNSPCDHTLYRSGDSWLEEVCLKRTMFATARRRVAVKVRISCPDEIQSAFNEGALVVYGTDENHLTWYIVNEQALQSRSPSLYIRLFGAETSANTPSIKQPRPTQRAKSAESPQIPVPQPTPLMVPREASPTIPLVTSHCPTSPSAGAEPLNSPMQDVYIGLYTEKTTQKASENSLQKQIPTTDIPLPTTPAPIAGEGGEAYQSKRRQITFAIFKGLQERSVQQDPARLIARRAVQAGWGVERTLEVFDAHVLDAERAGVRSPVGVAVSRMLDSGQITPAPAWAVARVRRLNQEQTRAERCEALDAVERIDDSDHIPEGGEQLFKKSPLKTLWERVLGDIKLQVTRATFDQRFRNTWLEQLGDQYVVCAKDPHTVEWLTHRLHQMITTTLRRYVGAEVLVGFLEG
jgi:hypothetical protein